MTPPSLLAGVIILEGPPLRLNSRVAVLHDQLILCLVDRQTPVGRTVAQQVRIVRIVPVLIAPRAMARVQDNVVTGVIEARFIPSDLSRFAQHPVLKLVREGRAMSRTG
uniref:Uncharacterized protein n=1 Tax=Anopheles maculatus TaxID=74869 RepID=A0A182T3M6_9DIPT